MASRAGGHAAPTRSSRRPRLLAAPRRQEPHAKEPGGLPRGAGPKQDARLAREEKAKCGGAWDAQTLGSAGAGAVTGSSALQGWLFACVSLSSALRESPTLLSEQQQLGETAAGEA